MLFLYLLLALVSMGVLAPPAWGIHPAGVGGHDSSLFRDHSFDNPSNKLTDSDLLRLAEICVVDRSQLLGFASGCVQDVVALRRNTESLQGQYVSLQNEHMTQIRDLETLQNKQAGLIRKHSSLRRRHQRQSLEHTELAQDFATLQQLHEQLLQEHGALRSAKERSERALREVTAKNGRLSSRLRQSEAKAVKVKRENRHLKKEFESLKEQMEGDNTYYENVIEKCEQEKIVMKLEIEEKEKDFVKSRDRLAEELRREVQENTKYYEKVVEKCQQEKIVMTKEIEEKKKDFLRSRERLMDKLRKERTENTNYDRLVDELRKEIKENTNYYENVVEKCQQEKIVMTKEIEDKEEGLLTSRDRLVEDLRNSRQEKEELVTLLTQLEYDNEQMESFYTSALDECMENEKKRADRDDVSEDEADYRVIEHEIVYPDKPEAPSTYSDKKDVLIEEEITNDSTEVPQAEDSGQELYTEISNVVTESSVDKADYDYIVSEEVIIAIHNEPEAPDVYAYEREDAVLEEEITINNTEVMQTEDIGLELVTEKWNVFTDASVDTGDFKYTVTEKEIIVIPGDPEAPVLRTTIKKTGLFLEDEITVHNTETFEG